MITNLPKPAFWAFLFTSLLFLGCMSFISYPINTLIKPIPIVCLISAVYQTGLIRWAKILILSALFLSLLGDVVLTIPMQLGLELGIAYFFLAHCCFIVLFLKHYQFQRTNLWAFMPVLLFAIAYCYVLCPRLGPLLVPVLMYFVVILTMVYTAFQVKKERLSIIIGALFFMISDTVLSANLFLYQHLNLSLMVMFTYYCAQLFITNGLAGLYLKKS